MKRLWLCLILALGLGAAQTQTQPSTPATAPDPNRFMTVGTGTPSATYHAVFKDMGRVCTNAAYLLERGTSGTVENLELLLANQISMGFMQVDGLIAKRDLDGDNRVNQIKSLLTLYPSEAHVVVKANLEIVSGNFFTRRRVPVTQFSQLTGRKIGVWGGALVTARLLLRQTGMKFEVVPFQGRDAQANALKALEAGQIDAAMTVAGKPIPWIAQLPQGQYRLVAFDLMDKLDPKVYQPARISYANTNLEAVPTFSVLSILATRDFRTPERARQLTRYRDCVVGKIDQLREGLGNHPKWSEVDFKVAAPWPVYTPPQ
ncbi:MAG: TAXI family TRAP transporter solute-binding subunit [Meiothermus sp.]|nr:TAXI family TRAP transporter solute-binding subunit [Meiothermus sp.]